MTNTGMQHHEAAMAQAFRETALGLICLFEAYGVRGGLADAAGKVIWRILSRHLGRLPADIALKAPESLHKIADDLAGIRGAPRRQKGITGSAAASYGHSHKHGPPHDNTQVKDETGRKGNMPAKHGIAQKSGESANHISPPPEAYFSAEEALQLINRLLAEFDKQVTEGPSKNLGAVS